VSLPLDHQSDGQPEQQEQDDDNDCEQAQDGSICQLGSVIRITLVLAPTTILLSIAEITAARPGCRDCAD
jgi:hypothetical protein